MRSGIQWLAAAALALAPAASAAGLIEAIEAASGRPVRGQRPVGGELAPGSRTLLGQPTRLTNPQRVFQGEVLDLEGGLVLERVRFEDPSVALEYADALIGATDAEGHGQVVVEVRGNCALVLRAMRQDPPLDREAERIFPAAWGRGKAALVPRSYIGLRDERGLAISTAPRGPLHEQLERTFELARSRKEPPPGFEWANAEKSAFRFNGADGVRVVVDASTSPSLMVRGSKETMSDMARSLRNLERALPVPREDLATTRRIAGAGEPAALAQGPTAQGPTAQGPAAQPAVATPEPAGGAQGKRAGGVAGALGR